MNKILIRKLIYRSWHRGTKELDMILGNFAESNLHNLNETELNEYLVILDEEDPDLYQWLVNNQNPNKNIDMNIINKIRNFINDNKISYD
ncbi:MAG: succinate dehydrogenase assembly factor 2 [Rhodobiaceae bacterium]|jgi:antitoxin CptB|nr:succinate dehydrogenase assembly factor 2 [Rhodobiaceae bacterium]MDB4831587.1 succinate dehydrogenase assembly factor 2 [Hyphomicrobiales bacterium]|tara:strand:- start:601 stop:870 length:270 start_codon:yes stop_codon:yes gene_type:complete